MKDIKRHWTGYEDVEFYWITPPDQPVYIVWAKDKEQLRRFFAPWLRWLPTSVLWRLKIWLMTH